VVAAVVGALSRIAGLRAAEAGEFTRRAFENGKLDLTAAEGIADLVDAQTEFQRRQALRQMEGHLGARYEAWRRRLLVAVAGLEAHIDFPEDDLPSGLLQDVRQEARALELDIVDHLQDGRRGERLRDGVVVALLGAPNAGKSSLLNYLAGKDAAIVSARAGTTRDVVEVSMDIGGYPVTLADTAGLRDAADDVEAEGVRRALEKARDADIRILMFDAACLPQLDRKTISLRDGREINVLSRCDLRPIKVQAVPEEGLLAISVKNGDGLDELLTALRARVEAIAGLQESPAMTRIRHRQALEACVASLSGAATAEAPEVVAEELRLAARAIGRVVGKIDIEDVLDTVFRDFCIGK
jgi:tRNA modification GTPase